MSVKEKLGWINTMLQGGYPSFAHICADKDEHDAWLALVGRIEARLMFLCTLAPAILRQGRAVHHSADDETLTRQELEGVVAVLDDISFYAMNNPADLSEPVHQGLSKLMQFKSGLIRDPVMRSITFHAAQAIASKTTSAFPRIASVPDDDNIRRELYRAYAFYSINLGVIDFKQDVIKSVAFSPTWAEQDEGIIYSLLGYIMKENKLDRLPGVERLAHKGYENVSHFKAVIGLMKVIS